MTEGDIHLLFCSLIDRRTASRQTPPYAETPLYTRSSAISFAATQDREQDSSNTIEFDMEQIGIPWSPTLRESTSKQRLNQQVEILFKMKKMF